MGRFLLFWGSFFLFWGDLGCFSVIGAQTLKTSEHLRKSTQISKKHKTRTRRHANNAGNLPGPSPIAPRDKISRSGEPLTPIGTGAHRASISPIGIVLSEPHRENYLSGLCLAIDRLRNLWGVECTSGLPGLEPPRAGPTPSGFRPHREKITLLGVAPFQVSGRSGSLWIAPCWTKRPATRRLPPRGSLRIQAQQYDIAIVTRTTPEICQAPVPSRPGIKYPVRGNPSLR